MNKGRKAQGTYRGEAKDFGVAFRSLVRRVWGEVPSPCDIVTLLIFIPSCEKMFSSGKLLVIEGQY